jgi:hypothetical protein
VRVGVFFDFGVFVGVGVLVGVGVRVLVGFGVLVGLGVRVLVGFGVLVGLRVLASAALWSDCGPSPRTGLEKMSPKARNKMSRLTAPAYRLVGTLCGKQ